MCIKFKIWIWKNGWKSKFYAEVCAWLHRMNGWLQLRFDFQIIIRDWYTGALSPF